MPEHKNPLSRLFISLYRPIISLVITWRKVTILIAVLIMAVTYFPAKQLGSEFMPPLNEGDLLYMPTTLQGFP
jgi:Cu(I)/Ag(I) efflux system membrane protein CusA/SilA